MSKPIQFTGTVKAWISSPKYNTLDDVIRRTAENPTNGADMLSYSNAEMGFGDCAWLHVGEAQITVTLNSREVVTATHIESLKAELQHERAESMQRQNAILDRISNLSALCFDASEVAE